MAVVAIPGDAQEERPQHHQSDAGTGQVAERIGNGSNRKAGHGAHYPIEGHLFDFRCR